MTALSHGLHPVLACLVVLDRALDAVSGCDPAWLEAEGKRAALLGLSSVASRVEELRMRILHAGQVLGDVAEADGARDAASWLAAAAHLDLAHARHLAHLGRQVEARPVLAQALREGHLDLERAAVVVKALAALPEDLDAEVVARAEARLVEDAASFAPRQLAALGRRILALVAPEVGEAHEAAVLAAEEAHAAATCFLRLRRRGDGTVDLHGRLSEATAQRLSTYLHAFTSPRQHRRPTATGVDETTDAAATAARAPVDRRRPHDELLGTAFGAMLETLDPTRLPVHGGDATTVVVTLDLDSLRAQLRDAGVALAGDEPLTAAHARRLACTAKIIPAVLDGASQVLDLGRSPRLFTPAQRKALLLRHPTCAATGCDIPGPWCEAHHAGTPWASGGRTDLAEGVLLCSHHHHRAHDPRYDTTRHPDGSVRYARRT